MSNAMDKPAQHFIFLGGIGITTIPITEMFKGRHAAWAQIVEILEMHDGFYLSHKLTKFHLALFNSETK